MQGGQAQRVQLAIAIALKPLVCCACSACLPFSAAFSLASCAWHGKWAGLRGAAAAAARWAFPLELQDCADFPSAPPLQVLLLDEPTSALDTESTSR